MFLALRYNCVLLKKDMHHLKNIWFFYHLPKFENELTQKYLSFNYQFFNYCVMSTWLLLCRDVSLPLNTFLNLEVEYSKASLKHFFTYNYIFSIHDLPGCNSPETEVASAPSHVSRKTRAHPIVHEFEYNLHIHWFRVQPTLSRQNEPLLNMTLNLFTTEQSAIIGCLRYAQCGKPRGRGVPSVLKAEAFIILLPFCNHWFARSDFLWIYLNFYLHLETIIPEQCIVLFII